MAFGFLGRRRRGPRRDRGGPVTPPEARLPHEEDQAVQPPPPRPQDTPRRAARDEQSGRKDTEARCGCADDLPRDADRPAAKPGPVIVRRRYRI
jgi:hypothetical protein